MLDIENLEQLFHKVVNSDDWKELQEKFNELKLFHLNVCSSLFNSSGLAIIQKELESLFIELETVLNKDAVDNYNFEYDLISSENNYTVKNNSLELSYTFGDKITFTLSTNIVSSGEAVIKNSEGEFLSSNVAMCIFTLGAKFSYKGTFNDDLPTVTSIFKKIDGIWKIHWMQRSTGDSDLSLWD